MTANPLHDFSLDVRLACRRLLKGPGYLMIAMLVLGIGIGANMAIFSIVDALLLRPFAFPDPDRCWDAGNPIGAKDPRGCSPRRPEAQAWSRKGVMFVIQRRAKGS